MYILTRDGSGHAIATDRDRPGYMRWIRRSSCHTCVDHQIDYLKDRCRPDPKCACMLMSERLSRRSSLLLGGLARVATAQGSPSSRSTLRVLTYSTRDVIDRRISVPAQHSLVRLSKDPGPSADAVGMLAEIKAGRLAGIYCVNWEKPAQRAIRFGQTWWTAIPPGEDAVLMLDPDNPSGGQPLIAFRRELDPRRKEGCGYLPNEQSFPPSPGRLDSALLKAWSAYRFWLTGNLVPCSQRAGVPAQNVMPPEFCQATGQASLPSCPSPPTGS